MVDPGDVPRILSDAARLVRSGEIVVFGSGALAFWLTDPPRTRDVDLWCAPAERGDLVEALMGEMSWYHERHGSYVEVWGPETFAAPSDWRLRAREVRLDGAPDVRVLIPHPWDVIFAKLERMEPQDVEHARLVQREWPLDAAVIDELAAASPCRAGGVTDPERCARFEHGLARLRALVSQR